jgi:predicted TPR repeat methyltransferase
MHAEHSTNTVESDHPESLLRLALARQSEGDILGALEAVGRALALDSRFAEAYAVLGDLKRAQGNPGEALNALKKGLALNGELPSLSNSLGCLLRDTKRFEEEAREAFIKAISLAPQDAAIHYNAGLTLRLLEDLDGARMQFERAVALAPDLSSAHFELGTVLEEQEESQAAVHAYQRAIRLAPTAPAPHRRLGKLLAEFQKLDEAQVCFENVLRIDPDDLDGLEGLADVFREKEQPDKAIPLYRRLADQGNPTATHFLAALTGELTIAPPRGYVKELFDGYSEEFEEHLTGELDYRTPTALCDLFSRTLSGERRIENGLDLGCGTGLAGLEFGKLVTRLEGVDLSPEMLKHARRKGVYSELHEGDAVDFLNTTTERYDLFVACDVLIYIGDLDELFRAIRKRSAVGSLVAFSVERSAASRDYELRPSGRYAHSPEYIERRANTCGFEVVTRSLEPLRKESDEWVEGALFILRALPEENLIAD